MIWRVGRAMLKEHKIVFFFPSYTLGGVQTLFVRIIKRLVLQGYNVGYVDFFDGVIRKSLIDLEKAEFLDINKLNAETISEKYKITVVTAFCFINVAPIYFSRESNFLLWFLSPFNLPLKNLSRKISVDLESISLIKKIIFRLP